MAIRSYKDLLVWQKGMDLVDCVYQIVGFLPKHEQYILISQMLRAAISIPSNIAEGYRRRHKAEYIQFLSIALASAAELETQLLIAKRQYVQLNCEKANALVEEVQKMLYALIISVKNN